MSDNWEDWEIDELTIPNLNLNLNSKEDSERLKLLEERKLVIESDYNIAKQLFNDDEEEDLIYKELNQIKTNNIVSKITPIPTKVPNLNKIKSAEQKCIEQKQKENSKNAKIAKAQMQKEKEIFGDVNYDDTYSEYENKFYY